MGGDINAFSQIGKGSDFVMTLPLIYVKKDLKIQNSTNIGSLPSGTIKNKISSL